MRDKKSILDMLHEYNFTIKNMMEAFEECQKGISELMQEVTSMRDDDTTEPKKYVGRYYTCSPQDKDSVAAVLMTFAEEPVLVYDDGRCTNGRPRIDICCRKTSFDFFDENCGTLDIEKRSGKVYNYESVEDWLNKWGYIEITENEYLRLLNFALSRIKQFSQFSEVPEEG